MLGVIEKFRALIDDDLSGLSGVAHDLREYLLLSTLETDIKKNRESLKKKIFSIPRAKRLLDQAEKDVRALDVAANITIVSAKGYTGMVQINPGSQYVDMDILRDTLGITEEKWNSALDAARLRRNPNFTLKIVR